VTTGRQLPGVNQLVAAFRTFSYSVFRLETLQVYAGAGEDEGIAAFHRGDPHPPPDPAEDDWVAMLREHYELTWEYGPHTAAGEDIRIIPVTDQWPEYVPRSDFTLFDSRMLFRLHYTPDGTWLGAEPTTDPTSVVAACSARDAALHHAIPWATYMTRHPDLVHRLPNGS
jgi:hypothetical protein